MAEPQRRRQTADARRASEVVHVLDPASIFRGRGMKGLTRAKLGELCGRSGEAVRQIENGELTKILPSFARDLTRELDLDASRVFGVAAGATPSSSSAVTP